MKSLGGFSMNKILVVALLIVISGQLGCANSNKKVIKPSIPSKQMSFKASIDVLKEIKALVSDYSSEYETQITLLIDSETDSIFHSITLLPPKKDYSEHIGFILKYDLRGKQWHFVALEPNFREYSTNIWDDQLLVDYNIHGRIYTHSINKHTLHLDEKGHDLDYAQNVFLLKRHRMYRFGRNLNQVYFISAFDDELNLLWRYPKMENDLSGFFPLFESIELDNMFHLIFRYNSNPLDAYLHHLVIQAETGEILLDETLLPDTDEPWDDSGRNPGNIGKRVLWDGKEVFIQGQDQAGVYLSKFQLTDSNSLQLLWKTTIPDTFFDNDVFPSHSEDAGIKLIEIQQQKRILMPLWKTPDTFDLYCFDPLDGKQTWLCSSVPGKDIVIDTDQENIVLYSKYDPIFVSIDSQKGTINWSKTISSENEVQVEYFNSHFYVFITEQKKIQKLDARSGNLIAEYPLNFPKPVLGQFYKNQDHLWVLINDQDEKCEGKMTLAQVMELE